MAAPRLWSARARQQFLSDATEIIASTMEFVLTNLHGGVQCASGVSYIFS
jgi:hypothetical protein